jgi:multidrug efflux system outer membrane protein
MRKTLIALAIGVTVLNGCSLIPEYSRPDAPIPAQYAKIQASASADKATAEQGWRNFFKDPALRQLVQTALDNNRDLKVAVLNVEAYRAQYRIQRADLLPAVNADASGTRQRTPADLSQSGSSSVSGQYGVNLGVSAYELDLFGRVRSLSEEALQTYLAGDEARRATQISLVASVANAYLTWQADRELLELTQATLATYNQSLHLTSRSNEIGVASALDVAQARTSVESARASLATYQRQVAQDENALQLLLGTRLPTDLPEPQKLAADSLEDVPQGLSSELLTRRPDVLQAEYVLKAANADIGAARAAFFPSITLTASAGTSSAHLAGLFKGGSGAWSFAPAINLPIFNAGALKASLDYSKIQKDIGVATYEKAIQTAFREVSDGLAARQTYKDQMQAQQDLVKASHDYYGLAERRYRTGIDSNLTLLDAQRSLFSNQQTLISDRLAQLQAEVNLYRALGGGWVAETQSVSIAP